MLSDRFFPKHYRAIGLFALASSIMLTGLGSARLWDRDEPRNARCAEEMLARGEWIVPTFNDQLRVHKPVLLYWLQMVSYQAFGSSEWAARLPSALFGILTIFTVAFLASRLAGERRAVSMTGFWAGAALATCLLFVMAGRAATPDSCLIALSTLGIAALVIGAVRIDPALGSSFLKQELASASRYSVDAVRWPLAVIGYSSLGLAILAKGPVGLILPMFVVHLWWMLNQPSCWKSNNKNRSSDDWQKPGNRHLLATGIIRVARNFLQCSLENVVHIIRLCWRAIVNLRTIPGCLLAVLIAAPWYIEVGLATGGAFLRGFFLEHNLGRAVSSMEGHDGSIFYYPLAFVIGTFPWSLWLIPIALWAKATLRRYPVAISLGVVWILVYVGAFTVASTKLPSYITPCYPGAALIIGGYLRDFRLANAMPKLIWRRMAGALGILIGASVAISLPIVAWQQHMPLVGIAGISGVALAAFCAIGLLQDRKHTRLTPVTWLAGATAFQIGLFAIGAGLASRYRSDVDTLLHVQAERPASQWICLGGMEPSWVYYLKQPIIELASANDATANALTLDRLHRLFAHCPDTNIIMDADFAGRLQLDSTSQQGLHWDLQEAARCNRFLRPGELVIYCRRQPQFADRNPTPAFAY